MVATTSLVHSLLLMSLALVCGSWIAIGCQVSVRDRVRVGVRVRTLPDTMDAESECKIERVITTVKYDGCEDANITVRACNGACISAIQATLHPPFFHLLCTSCQPTIYSSSVKMVKFMCNGTETTHRVYRPLIKECGCVNTTTSI